MELGTTCGVPTIPVAVPVNASEAGPWLDVEQLEQTADALEAQQDSEEISAQGLRRENHKPHGSLWQEQHVCQ